MAVLLLDRRLNTELRLLIWTLYCCSGECIVPCGVWPKPWVMQRSGVGEVVKGPVTGDSIEDRLDCGRPSLLWNENIAWRLGERPERTLQLCAVSVRQCLYGVCKTPQLVGRIIQICNHRAFKGRFEPKALGKPVVHASSGVMR